MSTLLTGLSNGQREGWGSDFIVQMLAVAAVAGISFLVWELNVPHPLVNLRVLAVGPFAAAACVAVVFGIGQFGTTFLIPLFVQTIQGLTPLDSGLLLMTLQLWPDSPNAEQLRSAYALPGVWVPMVFSIGMLTAA